MNKVEPQWGVKMKQMLRRQPLPSWRPHQVECASLTLISFPDGLISTGDRAFEGAAPLLAPIPKGILIIRISDVEQRHASFLSNAQSLLQGSGIDAPLNDVGRAQASALARSLASIQMDLIASSTLSRAVETADIVASQLLIVQFSMGNYTLVM